MRIANLPKDAQIVQQTIKAVWGCEVTLAFAQALIEFVEQMTQQQAAGYEVKREAKPR